MALLNAIDLRLRAAQIVVTGEGPVPTRCSPRPENCRRSTALCCMPARRRASGRAPGARQNRRGEGAGSLHLRWRNVLVTGNRSRRAQRRHRRSATFLTVQLHSGTVCALWKTVRAPTTETRNHATRIDLGGCALPHYRRPARAPTNGAAMLPMRTQMIECGYTTADQCESAVGKGGMCFVDPDTALNIRRFTPLMRPRTATNS